MKFSVIYADCSWGSNTQFGRDRKKGNPQHYPLMGLEQIKSLPVKDIAGTNCVLFLWVVDTQLFDASKVIETWGFTYKTVAFTWVKKTVLGKDHFGVGQWTRKNPELCLLSTRGHPKRVNASIRQLQYHLVREHSRKPAEIRRQIVQLMGDLPRIELFAREAVEGWVAIGDSITGNDIRKDLEFIATL